MPSFSPRPVPGALVTLLACLLLGPACDGPFVRLGRFAADDEGAQQDGKPDGGGPTGMDAGAGDGGMDVGAPTDAGPVDAGSTDAGRDAGPIDAGMDAGPIDAGMDAGPTDAGMDAGPMDAGMDAGPMDAGMDAGSADAGMDAGPDDAGTGPTMDTGAPLDTGMPADAGDPFEGVMGCLVGEPAHPTIQSALDDVGCPTVLVPAGTWHEQLQIGRDVLVLGEARATTIVDAQRLDRPLAVDSSVTATVRELTLTGGEQSAGGGVYNEGALTLAAVDVVDNRVVSAAGRGAGIMSFIGDLSLTEGTRVAGNRLAPDGSGTLFNAYGGGIYGLGAGTVDLGDGVIIEDNGMDVVVTAGNTVELRGGGVAIDPGVTLTSTGTGVVIRNNLLRLDDQSGAVSNHELFGGGIYCNGATVRLEAGDVIEGNALSATTAAALAHTYGGAIAAIGCGPVQLTGATVQNNRAETFATHIGTSYGGAVYSDESLLVLDGSYVGFNRAVAQAVPGDTQSQDARGGAVAMVGTTATFRDTTFEGNGCDAVGPITTLAWGGAIAAYAVDATQTNTLVLDRTTLVDNLAIANAGALTGEAAGGGLYLAAFGADASVSVELINSTLSANTVETLGTGTLVSRGGGIYLLDNGESAGVTLEVFNGTLVLNEATGGADNIGGGISVERLSTHDPAVSLYNTILTANQADNNRRDFGCTGSATIQLEGGAIHGTPLNQGGCTTTTGAGVYQRLPGYTPDPLADNGGATPTHGLQPGDPAIGAGDPTACQGPGASVLALDQRSVLRTGACDLGSVAAP